ncbi:MAG: HYR domain-containing protein, partial [Phaeodactylibacter sp.]|nr:HYR domain-containing protein [Phaeodactylibacter sp.]
GEDNTDYDAGYYLPAELGDFVWLDANANGTQDPGEPGIAGVTVILDGTTGAGEPVQLTQLTGSMGEYLFTNLQPGTYKVTFQAPAGLMLTAVNDPDATDATDSDADPAMGGMTGNYTLESGDSELTVDAGYFGNASIGDFVWNDLNANGIQDPNEPGIANVLVELTGTDNQGNPISATTLTGPDGFYLFSGLAAGSYKLTFSQPAGFDFASPLNAGAADEDSDADPTMGGMTVYEVLESGEYNPNYDAGYYQCPEITVFGLPLAPVCPGEPIGPLTIFTEPSAATISWTGGAGIGLADGSGSGPILEIPAFATTAEGSPIITVTATLGECIITSTFQLVVDDSVDPAFANCPEDIVVNNDVDKCGANVLWEEPVAFDACGSVATDVTQTEGPAPGSFISIDASPVTITYVADDGNGNDMSCSFTISVVDMQLPSIMCPTQFLTQSADADCAWTVDSDLIDASAWDNCGI